MFRYFDRDREIILKIDSFDYINEDVLSQKNNDNILYSIAFYSKNLISIEYNY